MSESDRDAYALMVGGGSQMLLEQALAMLVDDGDAVLLEQPCYSGTLAALNAIDCSRVPVPTGALCLGVVGKCF